MDSHWEWPSGHEIHTGMNLTKEGVLLPFSVFTGVFVPVGTYGHAEAQFAAWTNRGAPLSISVRSIFGGFFGGTRVQIGPQVAMRVGETFNAEVSWNRNAIDLPGGSFVTNLGRFRASYSFTTRMFVQAIV